MNKEFIPYEQALELKELGFNEECFGYYVGNELITSINDIFNTTEILIISAPLYQQAFRWFREKKIFGAVVPIDDWDYWGITILEQDCMAPFYVSYMSDMDYKEFSTHEEAELNCLKKLIETLKNK